MSEYKPEPTADPEIDRAVRRTVGIAALRKLRKLVDADAQQKAHDAAVGRVLVRVFGVLFLLALLWLALR